MQRNLADQRAGGAIGLGHDPQRFGIEFDADQSQPVDRGLDLDTLDLRYAIGKSVDDARREAALREWLGENPTAAALAALDEPIANLHADG